MKKHKLYQLFTQSTYEAMIKILRKTGQTDIQRELTKENCFHLPSFFEKHGTQYNVDIFPSTTVDLLIFTAEYLWATSGRTVIYPRSDSEMEIISKSSFKGLDVAPTTGEMMIIASPPDSGTPPLLAGCFYRSQIEKFNEFYRSQVEIPYNDALDLQSSVFIAVFRDPESGCFLTYEVAEKEISLYANASTTEEIVELMEKAPLVSIVGGVTHAERVKQAKIIKLALNFWMYKLSSPQSFVQGTPPVKAREYFGSRPTQAFSLSFADRLRGKKEGSISEVGIHMRNLRDERYYTSDEWKDKPRGSRWIEIGPYTRGGKGTMVADDIENSDAEVAGGKNDNSY